MYYVPDGTKECGYYECRKCGNRFLSLQTMKHIPCPDCEQEIDYEIGPDESALTSPMVLSTSADSNWLADPNSGQILADPIRATASRL